MKNKIIIVYRESLVQSIIADIFTFGVLIGSFYINHIYIKSNFLSGILLIVWLIFVMGKSNNRKFTFSEKQKAIDYINEKTKE